MLCIIISNNQNWVLGVRIPISYYYCWYGNNKLVPFYLLINVFRMFRKEAKKQEKIQISKCFTIFHFYFCHNSITNILGMMSEEYEQKIIYY
jgi:hypothetical protein